MPSSTSAAGVVSTSTSDYKYQGQMEAVVDMYTMGDAAGARKILETGQTKDAKPFRWAMRASPTRRASSSAKGPTWSASSPMNPRPIRRRRCWRWRMAWKQNCRFTGGRARPSNESEERQ